MTMVPEKPKADSANCGRYQFSLRFLLLLVAAVAVWLGILNRWPQYGISIAVAGVPGFLGLMIARGLALASKLPRASQWILGGFGFCLAVHNAWPVHASIGACGTHNYYEQGWPASFLVLEWGGGSFFAFHAELLAFDFFLCGFLLFIALRMARRLERSWHLEPSPTRSVAMVSLFVGPTILLALLRSMEFPQNVFVAAVGIPVAVGIIWGIHDSAHGASQPLATEESNEMR